MPPSSATRSLLADQALAARLRLWIVVGGALVIAAFVASSAYDSRASYEHMISATHRELENMARALAEQAGNTLQTSDLLLRDTVAWYETDAPGRASGPRPSWRTRASGLPQVREVGILDRAGIARFRSRKLPGGYCLSGRSRLFHCSPGSSRTWASF